VCYAVCSALGVAMFAGLLTGCETGEAREGNLAAEARVSRADAQRIALEKVPGGTVKEGEIERENGRLVWSFDIATPDSKDITEVLVDALTGAGVSVAKEPPAEQAKEKKKEGEREEGEKAKKN